MSMCSYRLLDALILYVDQFHRVFDGCVRISEKVALVLMPCQDCTLTELDRTDLTMSELITKPQLAIILQQ